MSTWIFREIGKDGQPNGKFGIVQAKNKLDLWLEISNWTDRRREVQIKKFKSGSMYIGAQKRTNLEYFFAVQSCLSKGLHDCLTDESGWKLASEMYFR